MLGGGNRTHTAVLKWQIHCIVPASNCCVPGRVDHIAVSPPSPLHSNCRVLDRFSLIILLCPRCRCVPAAPCVAVSPSPHVPAPVRWSRAVSPPPLYTLSVSPIAWSHAHSCCVPDRWSRAVSPIAPARAVSPIAGHVLCPRSLPIAGQTGLGVWPVKGC